MEIDFSLFIDKKDLKLIFGTFKKHKIDFPIYFIDLEDHVQIDFVSDYEEYELIRAIESLFPKYEFKNELEIGKSEIKIIVHRSQSPFSTDDWGRTIENPLNEKLYLIRKSTKEELDKKISFNPEVMVYHNEEVNSYYVNIIKGTKGEEKGFLILNDFENNLYGKENEVDFLKRFNRRLLDSFFYGISEMKSYVRDKIDKNKSKRKKSLNDTSANSGLK